MRKHGKWRFSLIIIPAIILSLGVAVAIFRGSPSVGRESAEEMYYLLESKPFDHDLAVSAFNRMKAAKGTHEEDDPWVYLSGSMAVLIAGYKIGDWYTESSFLPQTAEHALRIAAMARSQGPEISQVHAHYAKVLILKKQYREAWGVLDEAYRLDKTSFYPWYLRGIISEKMRDATRARDYFDEAEKRISRPYQYAFLNNHRQNLARLAGDLVEQERLLKENIAHYPKDAVYYGNYAQFLMRQKRYDESISYWEKAIELSPYQHAIDKLAEARRLRDEGK